ncbi:hypothetical protein F7725_000679 [Dissostichus mawsoni]|uniref:STAS domain-containing protein n=1 Tax=Dissostichus mawsoni TaxID=36200 RepID=A0A7J5ZF43_DISMA|nr:hypothetical protein F7725_000679 [Dissostichus mawsoni]
MERSSKRKGMGEVRRQGHKERGNMSASVAVYRNIYTEDRFKQAYGSSDDSTSGSLRLREKLAGSCRCSRRACLHLLSERVPIFNWLPRYRLKKWILGDTIGGLTVGILHIPQGMAFALLTSVAPIFGLYTSFFPVVLYMFFGTGRHVSTGTFAVVSLMTGSVVEQLVPTPLEMNSSSSEAADFEAQRIGVASAVALLSGIIMLGFLSTYLSEPIVKAFTSAAAFHVTVSQIQSMLGLRLPRHTGTFSLFKVIIATGVAYAFSLDSSYNIEIVGHIPAGFPKPRMPAVHTFPDIAGDTVAITFVGYAVSVSLAMIYADKHGYSIHPNQELLAHGISNTVSSFFTCFPSSATLATTNILESAGGYTQLSGLFTSLVVLIVLLLIGPLFYFLPKMVWVVTWLSVVVLNVDLGLAIGVVFSMMTVICRTQRAGCSVLGRASNTEIYRPLKNHNKCYEVPGVKILTYNGPIYYGNRSFFREEMSKLLGLTPEKIRSREKSRKALEKRERDATVSTVVKILFYNKRMSRVKNKTILSKIKCKCIMFCFFLPSSLFRRGIANTLFSSENEFFKSETSESDVQAVLIDCSSVTFVDVAGARLFTQMCTECQKVGVHVYLANCNESVLKILTSSGLMTYMNPQHIFVTVHDAVMYIQQQKEKPPENTTTVWV